MRKIINIDNKIFGKLKVISFSYKKRDSYYLVECLSCNKKYNVKKQDIKNNIYGCVDCSRSRKRGVNKLVNTPTYRTWVRIKGRCNNKNNSRYKDYGGRGIVVCDRLLKFEKFFEDMGERPDDKNSIDRIDNDGEYSKENCRWATDLEQSRNKRSNLLYTIKGETKCLKEWCEINNKLYLTVYQDIKRKGLSIEEALFGNKKHYD